MSNVLSDAGNDLSHIFKEFGQIVTGQKTANQLMYDPEHQAWLNNSQNPYGGYGNSPYGPPAPSDMTNSSSNNNDDFVKTVLVIIMVMFGLSIFSK